MTRFALFLAIAVAISCASHPTGLKGAVSELGAAHGYTLVNLHPDNERSRLYAVNFQQAGTTWVPLAQVSYQEGEGSQETKTKYLRKGIRSKGQSGEELVMMGKR